MRRQRQLLICAMTALSMTLAACAETELAIHAAKEIQNEFKDPAPKGRFKIGQPYQIKGVWYYPSDEPGYDSTGIASWYGQPFHGRATANGEVYDMMALTAAHKTLAMPTMVRVTNLENGRALNLRVNDRGPFVHGRIIDVSRRAAELLGFHKQGTARVRVQAIGRPDGTFVIARPQTPEDERTALPAVPRDDVASQTLPPPDGIDEAEPRPAKGRRAVRVATADASLPLDLGAKADGKVDIVPVKPTRLYIQAGAFAEFANAHRLRARLSPFGRIEVSSVQVKGRELFRVRLGPVNSVAQADDTLAKLIESGLHDARIIAD